MRRCGNGRAQAGFTLIELMVCLALVAATLAMASPVLGRLQSGFAFRNAAHDVADQMQQARARAIDGGRPAEFAIDLSTGVYRGGPDRIRRLPSGLQLSMLTVDGERLGRSAGAIRFFPDGSSTGGGIALVQGNRRLDVRVDWVTGRISVESPR
ncbi:MAG TPA: GspH/FimT family pseudopilin [Aliidongia sp.]|uniref:GspH/FimT family pseudopilin n=1 Tax=Aliidongia sp. TaxID=1914230 RepID=UPI002DDD581A|nr:GspH/FimT family pseudopilin [Aliidongia sp.]HEV2673307.1 GspH/FimT family pseudopilin [Aliidongia sp.]